MKWCCWLSPSGQTSDQFPVRVKWEQNRSVRPQPQSESCFDVLGHFTCPLISGMTMLTWVHTPTRALDRRLLKGMAGSTKKGLLQTFTSHDRSKRGTVEFLFTPLEAATSPYVTVGKKTSTNKATLQRGQVWERSQFLWKLSRFEQSIAVSHFSNPLPEGIIRYEHGEENCFAAPVYFLFNSINSC